VIYPSDCLRPSSGIQSLICFESALSIPSARLSQFMFELSVTKYQSAASTVQHLSNEAATSCPYDERDHMSQPGLRGAAHGVSARGPSIGTEALHSIQPHEAPGQLEVQSALLIGTQRANVFLDCFSSP